MPRTKTVTSSKKKKRSTGESTSSSDLKAFQQQQQQHTARELYEAAEHCLHSTSNDVTKFHQAITFYDGALNVSIDKADMDATVVLEKRAEAKVGIGDVEGARLDFERALQLVREQQPQPKNTDTNDIMSTSDPVTLERLSSLLMYLGQLGDGHEALEKYKEGIQLLEQSLKMRQQQYDQQKSTLATSQSANVSNANATEDALQETRSQIAAACSAAAEIYLTDLCYEDEAEQQCEILVQRALDVTSNSASYSQQEQQPTTNQEGQTQSRQQRNHSKASLDALQTAASLRLSQCRGMEAVAFMQQCFEIIRVPCQALCRLIDLHVGGSGPTAKTPRQEQDLDAEQQALELTKEEVEQQQTLPSFQFRCQTAKILLECSAVLKDQNGKTSITDNESLSKEKEKQSQWEVLPWSSVDCAEAAITVLGSLMAENDQDMELWYLMGDAFAALDDSEMSRYYYEQTKQMLELVREQLQEQQNEQMSSDDIDNQDEQEREEMVQTQLDEIECQLEDVEQKLRELPASPSSSKLKGASDVEPMEQD